jgi:hypothetical protein
MTSALGLYVMSSLQRSLAQCNATRNREDSHRGGEADEVDPTAPGSPHPEPRHDRTNYSHAVHTDGKGEGMTEIACMIWVTQQASFSSSGTYAAYFYEQAGLSVQNSFTQYAA